MEVEDNDDDDSEKYNSEIDTRSNQSSEYENDKVEMDDDNDAQNMSFDSIGSAISVMSLEDNFENILDSSEETEIFEESENPNSKTCTKFPNDAYKDLMLLVTKYKINNKGAIPDIMQNFALSYENFEYNGESIYGEQNTGKWWKTTQESLPTSSKLLSIILYSNATTTDTLGKSQLHPIYITLGNIPI
ncbi:hypothetical protein GLOIN_2v1838758 [Rhizophagus irregularis DAOM 181602=DAOM 197198]|nr:hypothetical protein GLOIN_2v1838758 [Rhizophagus irregularis DAOM 181602=DAOM 197198]